VSSPLAEFNTCHSERDEQVYEYVEIPLFSDPTFRRKSPEEAVLAVSATQLTASSATPIMSPLAKCSDTESGSSSSVKGVGGQITGEASEKWYRNDLRSQYASMISF
jgi:hypothetical protein